jgi:integrase
LRDAADSPSTIRKRRGMINRLRTELGAVPLATLSAKHVDQWMGRMRAAVDEDGERVYSDTTIANHWSCLRAILRQGDRWDVASTRPTSQARPPRRLSNRRPTPPTTAATAVLIARATPDLRIAAMLAAYAGLRRGEIMALRWTDVVGTAIHVRRAAVDVGGGRHEHKLPKSNEAREVRIDADLAAVLAAHRSDLERRSRDLGGTLAPDAFVLPRLVAASNTPSVPSDPNGQIARPLGWLTLAWSRHAEKCGAPDVRFHDLRHHYATELADEGVPWPVIQQQLGHLQLTTTLNIYTSAVAAGAEDAAERLRGRRALPNPS